MHGCTEQRGTVGVASSSSPAAVFLPCRLARLQQNRRRLTRRQIAAVSHLGQMQTTETLPTSTRQGPSAGPIGRLPRQATSRRALVEAPALPLYTCLDGDILTPANKFAYYEALRSGLKALRALGINGISVDVYWGIVEGVRPGEYDWSSYKQLFALIRDEGFMAQVGLCFHASDAVPLPAWVVDAGRANPDIYYTDRAGVCCIDYVSLGADEVPVLSGRTPLECYRDFMISFRRELGPLLGNTIADVLIGLGPDGELKYPAHPRDKRWTFPGVGEFQCYDRYLMAGLRACAQQVNQPSWGLRGPHDAGTYTVWPHQTGFFHQRGNWCSPYGKFFLQWYGDMLLRHADAVLGIAREVLLSGYDNDELSCVNDIAYQSYSNGSGGAGAPGWAGGDGDAESSYGGPPPLAEPGLIIPNDAVGGYGSLYGSGYGAGASAPPPPIRLHAKLPSLHWWYGTASHAPELTAGYYNTATRDGYLPVMHVLSHHGVGVRLSGGELRSHEMHSQACCDPERQLAQQRTVAAALQVPVGLENLTERFDEGALSRLEAALFDTSVHQGIELPQVQSLVFNRMCDSMFEPGNWSRFKDFVRRVRNRADTLVVPYWRGGAGSGGGAASFVRVNVPEAAEGRWATGPSSSSGGGVSVSNANGGGGAGGGGGGQQLQLA